MDGKVEIINAALLKLGVQLLVSENDDNKQARLANARWDSARKAVLRSHIWKFAKTRVALNALTTTPAFDWTYAIELPTDCVRLVQVMDGVPYELEGRTILCDSSSLNIRYIKDETDPQKFDALFCEALATYLAIELCYSLLASTGVKDELEKEFQAKLSKARNVDSTEDDRKSVDAKDWTAARFASIPNQ